MSSELRMRLAAEVGQLRQWIKDEDQRVQDAHARKRILKRRLTAKKKQLAGAE